MAEPSAVTRRMPDLEDAGAGNTETDALEYTRKFLEDKVSLRYRREEEEPAGRKTFLPTCSLVFRPGAGLLALLWTQQVEETWDSDLWWQ